MKLNKWIKIHFILAIVFLPFFGQAQSDLGNWWIYFGNKDLNKGFNLHHEIQYRNYNFIGDLEQLLIRAGLGYNLTENNNNILLGYGYINSENDIASLDGSPLISTNEHRIYQQFQTNQNWKRFSLTHRYRFEQRFVEDQDMKTRFRYFLAPVLQLTDAESDDLKWFLSAYDEIFLTAKEGEVFDRNRLYGGIGVGIKPGLKVEAGYMNQYLDGRKRDQLNMILRYSF